MTLKQTRILIFFTGLFTLASASLVAQNNKKCLEEVMALEELNNFRKDTAIDNKNIYMSYTVKATNWEDETTVSNVKLYKAENYMNFFSDQASIFMDEKEVFIIVPSQKLIIISSNSKELSNRKLNDEFFEMRRAFLDSAKVISCDTRNKVNVVVLKVDEKKVDERIKISQITYEYSSEEKKIKSTKVIYDEDYKIKQLIYI